MMSASTKENILDDEQPPLEVDVNRDSMMRRGLSLVEVTICRASVEQGASLFRPPSPAHTHRDVLFISQWI